MNKYKVLVAGMLECVALTMLEQSWTALAYDRPLDGTGKTRLIMAMKCAAQATAVEIFTHKLVGQKFAAKHNERMLGEPDVIAALQKLGEARAVTKKAKALRADA